MKTSFIRSTVLHGPSLQSKMLLWVTLVTVALISVIVWFDTYSLRKSVEEVYVSQLDGMTTAINGRYEESHSVEDVQQIFDYIQYKNPKVLQLTLFGQERILASTDRSRIGQPSPADLLDRLAEGPIPAEHLRDEADGVPKDRLLSPLKEDGETVGAIELLVDTSGSLDLIHERTQIIVIVGVAIALILLATLSLIIRKLLIRPLMIVREAALSVKQGSGYKPIPLDASYEINEVASSFNEMVAELEGRYRDLQQAQKQLVESEKMVALGSLVAGVSHEINTPIGIGVTAASFMDEKTKAIQALYAGNQMKRSDLEDYLRHMGETTGMIQSNLARASELIRSFKQVAVDRSAQVKRRIDVKAYIEELLVSLQPQLKKTKHRIGVEGEGAELTIDPGSLSQLMTNLIMNSLIHAYEDEDTGDIRIRVESNRQQVTIRYSDDGKGMSPDVAQHIFDPFFTTNRSGGGTGLGMHIAYNLVVQSMEGTIDCASRLGEGTTFTIRIPNREG